MPPMNGTRDQEAEEREARDRLHDVGEAEDRTRETRPPRQRDAQRERRSRRRARSRRRRAATCSPVSARISPRRSQKNASEPAHDPNSATNSRDERVRGRARQLLARADLADAAARRSTATRSARRNASRRSCVTSSTAAASRARHDEELLLHGAAGDRVEGAEGLVHQEQRRIRRERARHADALPLAARELRGRRVRRIPPAAVPPSSAARRRARGASASVQPSRRGTVSTFSRDGPVRKEAALLDDVADAAPQRDRILLRRGASEARAPSPRRRRARRLASFRAVVLPQPDGPTSATVSPARDRERKARRARAGPGTKALRTSTKFEGGGSQATRIRSWRHSTTRSSSAAAPAARPSRRLLARAGRRVVVVEREKFPRFHVGESLLPFSLPIFDRLGVHDKIRAAGLPGEVRRVLLERGQRHDAIGRLRRGAGHAPSDGLPGQARRVRRPPAAALRVLRRRGPRRDQRRGRALRGRPRGRRARRAAPEPRPEEIRAQVVVDASGQGAVLSRKLGLRRFDPKLKRAALFAHYEGIVWPEGSRRATSCCRSTTGVWYWIIPFSDGTCSVGGVFDPAAVRFAEGASVEARFEEMLARSPRMLELLAGARRVSRVHGVSDYSSTSEKLAGDGWVLVGDAATFLDPVFSTGVFLALATGERAAQTIDRALARRGRVDAPGLPRLRARSAKRMCAPIPALRLRLLRSGLLRGLLHARAPRGASAPPSSRRWPAASSASRPRCGSGRS